ncbi:MAG: efflux RND transporter permease subunit [Rhodopseudomonas palustris]|nr:efflux RND transporter permease subunit [Rhodopseudomonas palustris]
MKAEVPDVAEPSISLTEGLPQVEVAIDRDRAYSFGVSVQAAASEISASLNGYTATTYSDRRPRVRGRPDAPGAGPGQGPGPRRGSSCGAPQGRVPVANFASLGKSLGPVSIARENQSRVIHVTADIASDERPDRVEAKIREAIANTVVLPEGITLSYEGSWKSISETGQTFILIADHGPAFSVRGHGGAVRVLQGPPDQPLHHSPPGDRGGGGVPDHRASLCPPSRPSGWSCWSGIVVNTGIVLVDYTNLLVRTGYAGPGGLRGRGEARLRPVLMTTLTTILGLRPHGLLPGENSRA